MHLDRTSCRFPLALVALATLAALHSGCSQRERSARVLEQAHRYFDAAEYDKAEIEYKNVLQKEPLNAEAITRLGLLYHQQGRDGRAAVFLLKARDLQPENIEIRQKLALAYLASGSVNEARQEAVAVLERRPNDDLAPLILVEASVSAADLQDANLRLMALNPQAARHAAGIVALGNVALRQNRSKQAELAFQEALAIDAKCAAAHSSLAVLHWGAKNLPAAETAFQRAAELSPVRSPQRLHYASFKRQTGDAAAGRQLATELTQKAADYLPPWVWLADLALAEKKLDDADTFVAKALAREPLHPESLLLSARVRLARGSPAKAVDELERMFSYFPRSTQVAFHLGLAHAAAGDTAKAIARLTQLTAAAPDFLEAVTALAELHLRKRDFSAALAVLRPLAQSRPDALGARMLLAEAHRGQGNIDEAAALYAELSQKLSQEPQVAYARGTVLLQQGRFPQARSEFERARQLLPTHTGALEQLVELDLRDRQPAAARQRLEPELAKNPTSAALTFLLARVCRASSDDAGLEAALKRTTELDPNHTAAHYQLARLYVDTKRHDTAIANLKESTAKNRQALSPHLLLAVLLDERADYAGARDAYEHGLTLEPKSTLALNNLAYLYLERFNQPDKALEYAQRARALQPNEPRIADTLAWAMVKKKSYQPAVALLQESAQRLPDEPEVHYHLGVALYHVGDEAAAITALQRALDLNANFSAATDARDRLALLRLDAATATAEARAVVDRRLAAHADDPVAQLRRADLVRRDGDGARALPLYQALLAAHPKHAGALINIAELHAAKKDFPTALEHAKAARNAAPSHAGIAHRVGRIALDAGDHRWASSLLQEAAKQHPDDASVHIDWAEAAYVVGRVADADAAFRRALELAPSSPRAAVARRSLELIALTEDRARAAAARASIEATLKTAPNSAPALFALAVAQENGSDSASARQAYETLLARFPDFTPAQRNLTILLASATQESPKASALAAKARAAFPRDPLVTRAAGIIAYRHNELPKAVSLLQEFVTRHETDSEALYYLGMAQCRTNKLTEGRKTLQRALELGLAATLATEAKKRLVVAE